MRIIFTPTVLKDTAERLFPESKNRSKRIHKKLVKRHGGEFRRAPAMWNVNGVIYAHPAFRQEIERLTKQQEPLGEPFQSVLHDNLWNLYSR